jgi:hypothetical protein
VKSARSIRKGASSGQTAASLVENHARKPPSSALIANHASKPVLSEVPIRKSAGTAARTVGRSDRDPDLQPPVSLHDCMICMILYCLSPHIKIKQKKSRAKEVKNHVSHAVMQPTPKLVVV